MSTPSIMRGAGLRYSWSFALGIVSVFFSGLASADYGLNLPPPVTPIGREIFDLHNLILLVCVGIFIAVFGFMFYSVWAHRKSRGAKAATFHESATVETIWTTIPFLILVGMAIPSTATLLKMEDTRTDADMVVKVTGYQWKWKYEYPDHNVSFFSNLATPQEQITNQAAKGEHYLLEVDNPLVLPVGKKVRFLMTANDVIHSWWVPEFGVKTDAVPGFIHESWTRIDQPGIYRGQCAELCGKDHAYMPVVVQAVSQDEFNAWVAKQKAATQLAQADADKVWSKADLLAQGQKVYSANCAACHGPTGAGVPNVFPALTGSKIATGPVADHLNIVMKGKPGTAMAAFANQLSDVDIAAVVTFERNGLGNDTDDVIQPSQVKGLR